MNVLQTVPEGTVVRTDDGDTVPNICWQHYGERPGAAEAVFAANQDLAELEHHYQAGLILLLPTLAGTEIGVVRLWD